MLVMGNLSPCEKSSIFLHENDRLLLNMNSLSDEKGENIMWMIFFPEFCPGTSVFEADEIKGTLSPDVYEDMHRN